MSRSIKSIKNASEIIKIYDLMASEIDQKISKFGAGSRRPPRGGRRGMPGRRNPVGGAPAQTPKPSSPPPSAPSGGSAPSTPPPGSVAPGGAAPGGGARTPSPSPAVIGAPPRVQGQRSLSGFLLENNLTAAQEGEQLALKEVIKDKKYTGKNPGAPSPMLDAPGLNLFDKRNQILRRDNKKEIDWDSSKERQAVEDWAKECQSTSNYTPWTESAQYKTLLQEINALDPGSVNPAAAVRSPGSPGRALPGGMDARIPGLSGKISDYFYRIKKLPGSVRDGLGIKSKQDIYDEFEWNQDNGKLLSAKQNTDLTKYLKDPSQPITFDNILENFDGNVLKEIAVYSEEYHNIRKYNELRNQERIKNIARSKGRGPVPGVRERAKGYASRFWVYARGVGVIGGVSASSFFGLWILISSISYFFGTKPKAPPTPEEELDKLLNGSGQQVARDAEKITAPNGDQLITDIGTLSSIMSDTIPKLTDPKHINTYNSHVQYLNDIKSNLENLKSFAGKECNAQAISSKSGIKEFIRLTNEYQPMLSKYNAKMIQKNDPVKSTTTKVLSGLIEAKNLWSRCLDASERINNEVKIKSSQSSQ